MKLSRLRITVGVLTLIGLLAGWSPVGADPPKPEQPAVQRGFTDPWLLVERQDGSRTVLSNPKFGMLGDKVYLVGRTVFLEGISNDRFFDKMIQWVYLGDAHRLAEVADLTLLRDAADHEIKVRARLLGMPIEKIKTPLAK
jgi:hypothetical protein